MTVVPVLVVLVKGLYDYYFDCAFVSEIRLSDHEWVTIILNFDKDYDTISCSMRFTVFAVIYVAYQSKRVTKY